jgi:hypothetical protein
MSWSIIVAIIWVFVATATERLQYGPGITLLLLAPVLIIWLGYDFGWGWSIIFLLAFASMFRNLLKYIYARVRGQNPEIPK